MKNTIELLTRRDVGNRLRLSARTIRTLELQGRLEAIRLNKRVVRYHLADVEKLIA